jgi:hypothetical protein
MGNNNTNSHQAQFGRLRLPIFSDSISFIICGKSQRTECQIQTDPLPACNTA